MWSSSAFSEEGKVRCWLARVTWRLIASSLTGLALALVVVFRLRALTWQEWLTCAAAIPVLWIVDRYFSQKFIVPETNALFRVFVRVKSAIWFTVPVLFLMYGAFVVGFPDSPASEFAPWTRQGNESRINSATIGELEHLHNAWRTLEAYVLGRVSEVGKWGWAAAFTIYVACNAAFLYAYVSMLACFCIPYAELLSRAFGRATTSAEPPKCELGISFGSFAFVIFASILLAIVVMVEVSLMQLPPERRPMRQVREWIEAKGLTAPPLRQGEGITASVEVNLERLPERFPRQPKIVVEKIGDRFCRAGTIEELSEVRRSLLSSQSRDVNMLTQSINRGFDFMEGNIELFLAWYYSLPAEYTRIARILTGSFEGYLAEKFSEFLSRGEPFAAFEGAVSSLFESDPVERRKYGGTIERVLSRNCFTSYHSGQMVIVQEIDDPSAIFSYQSVIDSVHVRLATSGFSAVSGVAAGAKATGAAGKKVAALTGKKITAGVAKAVTKKIIAGSVFKTAAKVAVKVMAKVTSTSKAAGVGALVGGTVGSIVPIMGTTAGAVAGGVIGGLAFGVGVDALMLELDEAMNRSEFRAELVEALNLERQRMLDAIAPSTGEQ